MPSQKISAAASAEDLHQEMLLDQALEESFPASDVPSISFKGSVALQTAPDAIDPPKRS